MSLKEYTELIKNQSLYPLLDIEKIIDQLFAIQLEFLHNYGVNDIFSNSKFYEIIIANQLNHKPIPGHSGSRDAKNKHIICLIGQRRSINMEIITGGVTAAKGFKAAAAAAEIKYKGRTDMAMVYSEVPCVAAGTFTTNVVKAAPVKWDQNVVYNHPSAQAVICNSGIANDC